MKIFKTIISFNSVSMMNNFIGKKVATKMFFHYKTMFKNICSGLIWIKDLNISGMHSPAPLVARGVLASWGFVSRLKSICGNNAGFYTFIPRDMTFGSFANKVGWPYTMPSPRKGIADTFTGAVGDFFVFSKKFLLAKFTIFYSMLSKRLISTFVRTIFSSARCNITWPNQNWFCANKTSFSYRHILGNIILTFFILLSNQNVFASPPIKPNDFVSGTTIRSDEVDENFDELFGYLTVGIDNIRTGGLDALTEISSGLKSGADSTLITGTEGTAGQLGVWNSDGDLVATTGFTWSSNNAVIVSNGIFTTYTAYITGLRSCDTIDTDANGKLSCGTDASGAGGGDAITVNSSGATDPDFLDGDIDWTLTGGNSITATVGCSGCVDATDLGVDSVSASELNATGVEAELEAVMDLQDMQGAVTDTQVPNTITIDLATTATTANAGDSATAFFSAGTVEVTVGGTGATSLTDGGVLLGSGTGAVTPMAVLGSGEIIVGDGTTDPNNRAVTGDVTLTSTGLVAIVANALAGTEIQTQAILPTKLKQDDAPSDEECATYESSTGQFEWQTCGGSTGWTDDGTELRLDTSTDEVEIGSAGTLSAKLAVNGDADEIQALFQANATQTANLVVAEQSDGTDVWTVSNAGVVYAKEKGIFGSGVGCLMIRDTDDAGWTECFALNGVLSCTIDLDALCDGS